MPPVFFISDLCALLENYLEPAQVEKIFRAYQFGAQAHQGQHRMSGEPYIYHPLEVARILTEMHMDHASIAAALLHDVIEDTPTAKEQVASEFGEEVAELVDGVSKLKQVKFESRAEAQAENFRKMMLAMTRDIRVILIKLADRLHNMRTLGAMRPDKRRRIARETLDIYAPIANRLGMNDLRVELEDLGFEAMYPGRYRVLKEAVAKARGNRKEIVDKIRGNMQERLQQEGVTAPVIGREKHLYSIYEKMRKKNLRFTEVFDVYAFRILVDKVDTCYRVLGIVHNIYKPVPGKFKDYIAIPKANGYQSLHTVLFGPYGVHVEVQIRTEDMDKVSHAGIAAHWLYKTGGESTGPQAPAAREWLRELLEMQKSAGNSLEFLENVKIDLFPDEVYVFTPQGDIMTLPRGATAIDFAFAVHTDLGRSCVAAKIDRRLAPLRTELINGQTVEIITAPGAKPNPVWLDFVVTGKARANIRSFLKQLEREDAVILGGRILDKALATYHTSLKQLPPEHIDKVLASMKTATLNDLLADISFGNRVAALVARQLATAGDLDAEGPPPESPRKKLRGVLTRYTTGLFRSHVDTRKPLAIRGTEGTVVSYAKCCRPIPGDPIVGFLSAGRGIVIHVESCKNVKEFRAHPERWIDVQWEAEILGEFPVDIRVETANTRGVLATVAAAIAELEANIENVLIDEREGRIAIMTLTITVRDRKHLANIMRRVRTIDNVLRISRSK